MRSEVLVFESSDVSVTCFPEDLMLLRRPEFCRRKIPSDLVVELLS
jgi:hypothetical protein